MSEAAEFLALQEALSMFGAPRYASMGSPDDTVQFSVRRDVWEAWHKQASAACQHPRSLSPEARARARVLVDAAYHGYLFQEPNLAVEQLTAILAYSSRVPT